MQSANLIVFNATSSAVTVSSSAVDASQMIKLSVQVAFTDAASAGTLKIQSSNDHNRYSSNLPGTFTPTNWSDISGASVVVAGGATSVIAPIDACYQWIRLVWTRTGGAGTMTATVKSINF